MKLELTSPVFSHGDPIPTRYTCEGDNLSPPLEWHDVPDQTVVLTLVCEDLDAAGSNWLHWLIYNIPPEETGLAEGVPPVKEMDNGSAQGGNDFGDIGYGGPCPPDNRHRYALRLYALDMALELGTECTIPDLIVAMDGHILDRAELIGTYERRSSKRK